MMSETTSATNGGFAVGDRVSVIRAFPDGNQNLDVGSTGTVLLITPRTNGKVLLGVKWDEDIGGHNLEGCCPIGYGWNVFATEVCLCQEEEDYDMMPASDRELELLFCN